jgi:hypothetical protein
MGEGLREERLYLENQRLINEKNIERIQALFADFAVLAFDQDIRNHGYEINIHGLGGGKQEAILQPTAEILPSRVVRVGGDMSVLSKVALFASNYDYIALPLAKIDNLLHDLLKDWNEHGSPQVEILSMGYLDLCRRAVMVEVIQGLIKSPEYVIGTHGAKLAQISYRVTRVTAGSTKTSTRCFLEGIDEQMVVSVSYEGKLSGIREHSGLTVISGDIGSPNGFPQYLAVDPSWGYDFAKYLIRDKLHQEEFVDASEMYSGSCCD